MARKVMQLVLALLALLIYLVSGSPVSRTSDLNSVVLEPSKILDTQHQNVAHSFGDPDIAGLPPTPITASVLDHVNKHALHQPAHPQETDGVGTIYIARNEAGIDPPGGGDGQTSGCVIYIAPGGKVNTSTPPSGCASPPAQRVRNLNIPPQETKSSIFRVENHFPGQQAQRDVEHKPTFTTLVSPGLTTLTVSASTGHETGGVVVITGPVTHKSHKTCSTKTKSWVSPGTFTVTRGSGTFTVITTLPSHPEHTYVRSQIPPPEWLSTHVKTHGRQTDRPLPMETLQLAGRVPPPESEWLLAPSRAHPYTGTHVRPTDMPFAWRTSTSAKSKTHIHTMDRQSYSFKHKSETVLDPTHVRPTDKPVTWGLNRRDNVPPGIPTSFKPVPSPTCTLTVKKPTPTMKGNLKTVYTSTATVTHYHVCGGCLLVTDQPRTMDRKWEATRTVHGVATVTVNVCTGGPRRPTHGPVTQRDEYTGASSPVPTSSNLPATPFHTHGPPPNFTPRPSRSVIANPIHTHGQPPNVTPRPETLVTAVHSSSPANPMHTHGPPPLVTPRPAN
ncbi:hypothetical protein ONS95_002941 [Cadophora gregata]|uniref:uncharacterized protein n=1 Tax=Cadophora gregata TaxID=51156 RepID=UPI0026DAD167|nr:uncharacterized protein ONS95_002941 [Cadophora gregata]KAK0108118.1 hypothetical protein ONS95_002941 [Cadophora gregata]KAK0109290.1 hypothetical protein ONS96_003110 [Cadophora gregata f. sp. sojae]